MPLPTAPRLRQCLDYDPATGVLLWRIRPNGRVRVGSVAGHHDRFGYRLVGLDGGRHLAHRLVWLHVYGAHPDGEIDHINGIKDDNRVENLRVVSRSRNMLNMIGPRRSNTSGFTGVSHTAYGRWRSEIRVDGVSMHLGYFGTAVEAAAAYEAAKQSILAAPKPTGLC